MTAPESVLAIVMELAEAYDRKLSAAVLAAYVHDLQCYSLPDLEAVQVDLRRSMSRWPKIADWRERLDRRVAERPRPPRPEFHDQPCCRLCDDTGWRPDIRQCPGERNQTCRTLVPHPPHEWKVVRPCECRETNPVYQYNNPRKPEASCPPRRSKHGS